MPEVDPEADDETITPPRQTITSCITAFKNADFVSSFIKKLNFRALV